MGKAYFEEVPGFIGRNIFIDFFKAGGAGKKLFAVGKEARDVFGVEELDLFFVEGVFEVLILRERSYEALINEEEVEEAVVADKSCFAVPYLLPEEGETVKLFVLISLYHCLLSRRNFNYSQSHVLLLLVF